MYLKRESIDRHTVNNVQKIMSESILNKEMFEADLSVKTFEITDSRASL